MHCLNIILAYKSPKQLASSSKSKALMCTKGIMKLSGRKLRLVLLDTRQEIYRSEFIISRASYCKPLYKLFKPRKILASQISPTISHRTTNKNPAMAGVLLFNCLFLGWRTNLTNKFYILTKIHFLIFVQIKGGECWFWWWHILQSWQGIKFSNL